MVRGQGEERPGAVGDRTSAALRQVAEALNATIDPDAAVGALLPQLRHVVGLRTAWAFAYSPRERRFQPIAATGLPPALAADDEAALRLGSCECQRRFRSGELEGAVNMVRCSRLEDAEGDRGGLIVHASLRLKTEGRSLGILNVAAEGEGAFGPRELALLAAVGQQVAVAVDRGLLYRMERRRNRQLRVLAGLEHEFGETSGDARLVVRALDGAISRLGFPRSAVVDREPGGLTVPFARPRLDRAPEWPVAVPRRLPAGLRLWRDSGDGRALPLGTGPEGQRWLVVEAEPRQRFDEVDDEVLDMLNLHAAAALSRLAREALGREAAVLRERERIAADLHDAVSQRLFSALLSTRAASLAAGDAPQDVAGLLRRVEAQIAGAQGEMRRLVQALKPAGASDLLEGLQRLADVPVGPPVHLTLPRTFPNLTAHQAVTLLRIAEEAVHNALRHGAPTRVLVLVRRRGDRVVLSIRDDGQGFQVAQAPDDHGLDGMRRRARAVGARLTLTSCPGRGTTVTVSVPVSAPGDGSEEALR